MHSFTLDATNSFLEEQEGLLHHQTIRDSQEDHNATLNMIYQQPNLESQPGRPMIPNNNNDNAQNHDDISVQIADLTNRLRILFYTLTIPIVPLSVLLAVYLGQFVASTFNSPDCSHPIKSFAVLSALIVCYSPNHNRIKRFLFNDRIGNRSSAARFYDQMFHMCCFMYFYYGMALMQTCREDLDPVTGESTCQVTCPQVYNSYKRFSFVVNLFVVVLLLPLVFLPFVYLWIIRRINTEDAWMRLGRDMRRGSTGDDDLGSGVIIKEIMEGLRSVYLVHMNDAETKNDDETGISSGRGDSYYYGSTDLSNATHHSQKVRVVGRSIESWSGNETARDREALKDCCICMNEYTILDKDQTEHQDLLQKILTSQEEIVETKCHHIFHKACLGRWIGGVQWEDVSSLDLNGIARRRLCPLCREDLAVDGSNRV